MALKPLAGMKGKTFRAYGCLLAEGDRETPTTVRNLSTNNTAAAKGATTVTLSAAPAANTSIKMIAGQPLLFTAPNGTLIYAELTQAFTANGTAAALTVKSLDVEIPAGSTTTWPAECHTRNTFDRSSTAATVNLTSYEHVIQDTAVDSRTSTLTTDGYYNTLDPFNQMVSKAIAGNLEMGIVEAYPVPAAGYATGERKSYVVVPTGDTESKPVGGFLAYNATLSLQTDVVTTPAVATI